MSKIILSPMAGITDAPFRYLARKYGADVTISEMITAKTDLWSSRKTQFRLQDDWAYDDPHKIIQIAGASPDIVSNAAKLCQDLGATEAQINMGCPAKKVCNVLAGSALLKDEKLVLDILTTAVRAVNIPVTLKTRLGWDEEQENIQFIAELAEASGISSLTIHGRNRCDLYNGNARYEKIALVKQESKIPIFANGDLTSPERVKAVLDYTKADGAYIGRAALGRPWIFSQIKEYLAHGSYKEPSNSEKYNTILGHLSLIYQHYGEVMGVRIARKHIKWYWQSLFDKDINVDLALINPIEDRDSQYQCIKTILEDKFS